MKKLLIFLLTVALLLPLTACGGTDSSAYTIVATNFAAYDFACEIVGRDNTSFDVTFIAGGDAHSFDPTFGDVAKIEKADLFLYVGGDSDTAIDTLLKGMDRPNTFKLIDQVDLLHAKEEHEDDHDHDHASLHDEHVWTSPENAILIVTALCEEIALIDPENAALYRSNTMAYINTLIDLDRRFAELFENQSKTIVFGDRFPLLYFAERYQMRYEAAFPSCQATSEPSPTRVSELIALCQEENITHIFHIEGGAHSVCDRIAADCGGKAVLFHACHKVSASEMASGATYLSLMEANYLALKEALS